MPGAPQMRLGRPITERSAVHIALLFVILPALAGLGILLHLGWNVAVHSVSFTLKDWLLQVGLYGLLGLGVMTALPAVGFQELRRRTRQQDGAVNPEPTGAELVDPDSGRIIPRPSRNT